MVERTSREVRKAPQGTACTGVVKHMDNDTEIEEQRQRVLDENRSLSNECEYTKTKTEGFQTSARNGSGLLFPRSQL